MNNSQTVTSQPSPSARASSDHPVPGADQNQQPTAATIPITRPRVASLTSRAAFAYLGIFGFLLASFPARNVDLFKNLADGRSLIGAGAAFSPSWLFDVPAYLLFSAGGGAALVGAKALLCGLAAVMLFFLCMARGGRAVPFAIAGLAVLAMASRLLLQPATISVLLLVVCYCLLVRDDETGAALSSAWPGWRLVALFVIWGNTDARVVLGLALVALVWLGGMLDGSCSGSRLRGFARRSASLLILVGAACLSPEHVSALRPPPELRAGVAALGDADASRAVNSPFDWGFVSDSRDRPAALAYFPLLVLGVLSFALNLRGWRWTRFLPWLAFAAASALQVRLVPFFAVAAGPVTAWNLHEFFARRGSPAPSRSWIRYLGIACAVLLAVAFVICAWTGWLQGPPFEPRRWVVESPEALPRGAEFLRRASADGLWSADTRTLHASGEAASAFAWFCPDERALRDDVVVAHLLNLENAGLARDRLRMLGVSRVVVYAGDPTIASRSMLDRLLADPDEWPVLHLTGGLVVFGWRDPARAGAADPFANREVDFARLAFQPNESEVAPPGPPPGKRRWWDAFWKPAPPPRPLGRDEATVLLHKATAVARSAPFRHQAAWEVGQVSGLVGAASGWMGPAWAADLPLRLALFRPPIPDNAPLPAITRLTFAIQQQFAAGRGHAPVGVVYAAIRAARRAVAENPADANSYLSLGRAYAALATTTSEEDWTKRLPSLMRLRQVQASAALNRAVALNLKFADAHLELGQLYLSLDCLDLAAVHLQAYRDSPVHRGGPPKGSSQAEAIASELERLTTTLERQRREYAKESERSSVADRAVLAARRGLGGEARDQLLKSHLSAFGAGGMELELDLLLRTGRPEEVLEWMTPEVRGLLDDSSYLWLRAQALAAVGEYDEADAVVSELVSPTGRLPAPGLIAREMGLALGKAVLDEAVGAKTPPHAVVLAINRLRYRSQIDDMTVAARRSAEITVLRGLIALEAGFIDRARDAFRHALSLSAQRSGGGQLDFNARTIALDCLSLIEGRGR